MTREGATHAQERAQRNGSRSSSAGNDRLAHTMLRALICLVLAATWAVALATNDAGYATEKSRPSAGNVIDRRAGTSAQTGRASTALSNLQQLPESLRASFQAAADLSPKEVCRLAEGFVRTPAIDSMETVAKYLSKDVHSWSDLMITRLIKSDPMLTKAMDRGELKEVVLQQWASGRGVAQRWLQGCGVVVTTLIGRLRHRVAHDTPDVAADIAAVIAKGVRKNDPEAIAAAEALARADQNLKTLLK